MLRRTKVAPRGVNSDAIDFTKQRVAVLDATRLRRSLRLLASLRRLGLPLVVVLNRIDARFVFDEKGLIVRHRDTFDFWAWSRQALGMPGLLLGWTPMLQHKVRAQAAANLARFLAGRP